MESIGMVKNSGEYGQFQLLRILLEARYWSFFNINIYNIILYKIYFISYIVSWNQ